MDNKSRTTEVLAEELASCSKLLNRKMVDLVALRELVAKKQRAARARAESFSDGQKASLSEVPEKSRKFLESFLADRGTLL